MRGLIESVDGIICLLALLEYLAGRHSACCEQWLAYSRENN